MNPRQRMRWSNRKAVEFLLDNGYDQIWLKPHTRRKDLIYTQGTWYRALDLWNLFDGICFSQTGDIFFLQIKTNRWAEEEPILKFISKRKINVIIINVIFKRGKKTEVKIKHLNSGYIN